MEDLAWDTDLSNAKAQKEIPIDEKKSSIVSIIMWSWKGLSYVINFIISTVVSLVAMSILSLTAIVLIIVFQFVAVVLSIVILLALFILACCAISYIIAPEYTVERMKKIF